jgi:diadenosine tetraphosphate (Ap4A) HIT family hydrolase
MRDAAFELDPRLAGDSIAVGVLMLSELRLMDDARYPWLLLVPRRARMVEIIDLDDGDQTQLFDEVRQCARALRDLLRPDKLNVAALGNQVTQLHVHVIARFHGDDAWPRPVWGVHPPLRYAPADAEARVRELFSSIAGIRPPLP